MTTQGQQRRTANQGPPHWYPIPLPLRYTATSEQGPVFRLGHTRMMSSKDITFTAGDDLKPGMAAQIALAWPYRIVELRFFGGLTILETADVLGISTATVSRDWDLARAWLRRELSRNNV